MGDSYEDSLHQSVKETYCKIHKGLWPHECGCADKNKLEVCSGCLQKFPRKELFTSGDDYVCSQCCANHDGRWEVE